MEENELNVLMHELVPEHVILKDDEKKAVLDKFSVVAEQLPKILKSDPAAKAINVQEGDVIKITRKSPTAGVSIYYRFVVKK